jgi:hypothetical protein
MGILLGAVLRAPELVAHSVLAAVAASAWRSNGTAGLKRSLAPLALMACAVPLPFGMEQAWTKWASDYSTRLASSFLDLRNVLHAVSGPWIELPGQGLTVAAATAGIHGIPLILGGAILLAALRHRPAWHLVILVIATAVVAMGLNIAAVTLGIEWLYTEERDVWQQPMYTFFCVSLLLVAALFVFCFDRLLAFFSMPRRNSAKRTDAPAEPPPPSVPTFGIPGWAAMVLALAMCLPGAASLRHFRDLVSTSLTGDSLPVQTETLPFNLTEKLEGWSQQTPQDNPAIAFRFSAKASRWEFRKETLQITISIHAPFRGFKSIAANYEAMGWRVLSDSPGNLFPGAESFRRFQLRRPRFERAEVLCSALGPDGQWISSDPPAVSPGNLPMFLLKRSREFVAWLRHGINPKDDAERPQMLVHAAWTGDIPFQPDDEIAMYQLFNEAGLQLRSQLGRNLGQP